MRFSPLEITIEKIGERNKTYPARNKLSNGARENSLIGFKAKKSLGQNFLVDKNILNKIISACQLNKTDTILEIGPGLGVLTEEISKLAKKVTAVELDNRLCSLLKDKFRGSKNVEIIHKDILKVKIPNLKSLNGMDKAITVIGNLPFYITTPIITHLLGQRQYIRNIYITVQKEVAKRFVAQPKTDDYSAFSCFVQYYTKPKILFYIKRNSFQPAPKVDSAFIRLDIYEKPPLIVRDEALFFKIIRIGFNQRRKMLKNNLKSLIVDGRALSATDIISLFEESGLSCSARAEELSLSDFARLSNLL